MSEPEDSVAALAVVAAERAGKPFQAAFASFIVAGLLWLGVASGLDAKNPAPAISILLAGAALFSGVAAAQGEHRIVRRIFAASRRWLAVVAVVALAASASLAMEIPDKHPVEVWRVLAIIGTFAALRLGWSAIRAPT
jgi:drug/metabolite transporter (DMT)-like permease